MSHQPKSCRYNFHILYVKLLYILQQEQVLGELYWYVHQDPRPVDADATEETWQACHKLFEIGFLSHDRVSSLDSPILKNIDDGVDSDYPHISSNQKAFLSWQSECYRLCIVNIKY